MMFCINGKFISEAKAKISVLDNGFLYGDGFYDTMRAYDGVVLELDLHLKRIALSSEAMDLRLPWNTQTLATWILKIVRLNRLTEARIRVTVTRGNAHQSTLVITCSSMKNTFAITSAGIHACTVKMSRLFPAIKTLGGLSTMILGERYAALNNADEAIGISADGKVLEGATSNIFLVKNGRLMTPKNGILKGLTRQRILVLARKKGLKVFVKNIPQSALKSADEIFLTNRPREIIPVVRLNGKKVGSGKVGPVTKQLMAAYQEYVRAYVKRAE